MREYRFLKNMIETNLICLDVRVSETNTAPASKWVPQMSGSFFPLGRILPITQNLKVSINFLHFFLKLIQNWIKLPQKPPLFDFVPNVGTIRSSPSSPLFIPVKPEKESARRLRKRIKECRGGSTDSEGPAVIKETSKRNQRRGQTNLKSNKCTTAAKKMDEGRRGTEGTAEVSQQSKVADSCEDQATSVSQEETVTCSVREQPPSQETSRVHGEHCAAAAILVREKTAERNHPWFSNNLRPFCIWNTIKYLGGIKNSRVSFQRFKEGWLRGAETPAIETEGFLWRMCRNEQKVGAEPEQAQLVQGKQWVTVGTNWNPPGVLWIAL